MEHEEIDHEVRERKTVTVANGRGGTRIWSINLSTVQLILAILISSGGLIAGSVKVAAKVAEPVVMERVERELSRYVTVEQWQAQSRFEEQRWRNVDSTLNEIREDVRWLIRAQQGTPR